MLVVVAGWFAGLLGCRSPAPNATSFHRWGWEDAENAKAYLDAYKHVLLGCIYEDHWEDQGPNKYSLHRFKGTVVRTYKGDWRISERILFVHGVDSPPPTAPISNVGRLMLLLTDQHTEAEIGFEAGTFYTYDTELERVLQFLYPERMRR